MAFCTVNGSPVLEGVLTIPRVGVWHADVEIPAPASLPSGRARIALGDALTLVGTFGRLGPDGRGRLRARILGGAGGLGKTLAPKSYLGVPLRIPVVDVLTDAGENLSSSADASILAQQVPAWSRMQTVASTSLAAIVAAAAATWRVLVDGTVWIGVESWPTSTMKASAMAYMPEASRRVVATLTPSILPGQVYDGQRISLVQHVLTSRTFRTVLHIE